MARQIAFTKNGIVESGEPTSAPARIIRTTAISVEEPEFLVAVGTGTMDNNGSLAMGFAGTEIALPSNPIPWQRVTVGCVGEGLLQVSSSISFGGVDYVYISGSNSDSIITQDFMYVNPPNQWFPMYEVSGSI